MLIEKSTLQYCVNYGDIFLYHSVRLFRQFVEKKFPIIYFQRKEFCLIALDVFREIPYTEDTLN